MAAVIAGTVLIIIALVVMSDDGSGESGSGGETAPSGNPQQPPTGTSGNSAPGADLPKQVARRERVRAPGFSLVVIQRGAPPPQARGPLERASRSDELHLGGLKGTPVVLHMWSSDCTPCRADARLVQATWERWGRRGVAFVGLSVDEREQDALRFARRYGLTYPLVHDKAARAAKAYGVTTLPATFFISAAGDVVGHVAGSPSIRQMEFGAAAAQSARTIGSEQGKSSVPLG